MKTLIFNTVAGEVQALTENDAITRITLHDGDKWHNLRLTTENHRNGGKYYIGSVVNCMIVRIFLDAKGEWKCEEMAWRDCPKVS